jgi:hypothetical protein
MDVCFGHHGGEVVRCTGGCVEIHDLDREVVGMYNCRMRVESKAVFEFAP